MRAQLSLLGILLAAAPAYADNGGLTPVKPASENAQAIYDSYILILFVTGFVFVVVEATLVWFLVRYRRGDRRARGGPAGARTHADRGGVDDRAGGAARAHRRVRLREAARDRGRAAAGRQRVTVEGHQYYWLYRYPAARSRSTSSSFP